MREAARYAPAAAVVAAVVTRERGPHDWPFGVVDAVVEGRGAPGDELSAGHAGLRLRLDGSSLARSVRARAPRATGRRYGSGGVLSRRYTAGCSGPDRITEAGLA